MSSSPVFEAISLASHYHSGQYRKGTKIPYVIHPLNVGKILINSSLNEQIVIGGILHDLLEDTEATETLLKEKFGDDVLEIVLAASEKDKSLPWKKRKEETLDKLAALPEYLLHVPFADKLDNMRTLSEQLRIQGKGYLDNFGGSAWNQQWYYTELARIFKKRIVNRIPEHQLIEYARLVTKNFS